MILLIDDKRSSEESADVIARSFSAGISVLHGCLITSLYLDHDLGENDNIPINFGPLRRYYPNGVGILKWIQDHFDRAPITITLVSDNPVGKANMEAELVAMGYFRNPDTGTWILSED